MLLLCLALAGCGKGELVHAHGMDLSKAERRRLEQKAGSGDAAAAWRLYHYYSLEHHNESAADPWLKRAAKLKHPQAQRLLAYLIKDCGHSPSGFGAGAPIAVQSLLEEAAETDGKACRDLASAYADGYFGMPDQLKARFYFQRGAGFANRICWTNLCHYYRSGVGGPQDDAEAYYWISLEARCVDPRSMSGRATWTTREEIASHLSVPVLEREWQRIDAFMSRVNAGEITLDTAPFLAGMIDPKREAEGRRICQKREDEHRKTCKARDG